MINNVLNIYLRALKRISPRSLRPLRLKLLPLNRKQEWLLEGFRDPAQKTRGVGAIDQPVIVRE
jgi:hypothetical protein